MFLRLGHMHAHVTPPQYTLVFIVLQIDVDLKRLQVHKNLYRVLIHLVA